MDVLGQENLVETYHLNNDSKPNIFQYNPETKQHSKQFELDNDKKTNMEEEILSFLDTLTNFEQHEKL